MTKEIAVHTGEGGETAAIDVPGTIVFYRKQMGIWGVERTRDFALAPEKGLREMRKQVAELVADLGDCKVFVASAVNGVPYFELEKAGSSVWEFAGKPQDFLDYVLEKEEESAQAIAPESIVMPVPENLGKGCYRISIKEIQETGTGITSKQVLQPILRQENFHQLEVICNHIPPWLEADMMGGSFSCVSKKITPSESKVVIRKKKHGK
ncbi:MAG TPA: Fe-only nitrogenase accessory AnfO family protein [Methylomusa anaerophila]|uniref:Iron only nitrogenase protein AnfO n=1 Tax=Methylomusa anaerophila TaxID=1930071 RepID=A0A348ALT7_9FIRM|nr:Fe-only nitrogenase accessory AnfO family protein [Methylomusa anaerophila]BBB92035.1 Iron only nitrogenase protein AnfO [Methylomusa anaerophila]HML87954.1 Fe-only nitrogenase accessory AnfO family protein [Methylomusa anaerophila]